MNNQFDELTKSMAQSVTRRGALKQFSLGLAGMALACFGLVEKAAADPAGSACGCKSNADCKRSYYCYGGTCLPDWCNVVSNPHCCKGNPLKGGKVGFTGWPECDPGWGPHEAYCRANS